MIKTVLYEGKYPIMIYEKDGKEYSFLAVCPHKNRPILFEGYKIDNDKIECPFHHAVFSLITGELIKPPNSKTPCPADCKLIKVEFISSGVKFYGKPIIPELPRKDA